MNAFLIIVSAGCVALCIQITVDVFGLWWANRRARTNHRRNSFRRWLPLGRCWRRML